MYTCDIPKLVLLNIMSTNPSYARFSHAILSSCNDQRRLVLGTWEMQIAVPSYFINDLYICHCNATKQHGRTPTLVVGFYVTFVLRRTLRDLLLAWELPTVSITRGFGFHDTATSRPRSGRRRRRHKWSVFVGRTAPFLLLDTIVGNESKLPLY